MSPLAAAIVLCGARLASRELASPDGGSTEAAAGGTETAGPEDPVAPAPAPAPAAEQPTDVVAPPDPDPDPHAPRPVPDPTAVTDADQQVDAPADADPLPARAPSPLPPPPGRVDPQKLRSGPWRGRGWVTLRIDAVAPVGGERPARGELFSGAGGLWAGGRPLPFIGIFAGITTFIHDVERRSEVDAVTQEVLETSSFGRLTIFDLAVLRLWYPTKGRVQPFVDVGGFAGMYRAPYRDRRLAAGGGRFGAGVDVWLGPSFSLNFGIDERLIAVRRTIGHTLQFGFGATIHW